MKDILLTIVKTGLPSSLMAIMFSQGLRLAPGQQLVSYIPHALRGGNKARGGQDPARVGAPVVPRHIRRQERGVRQHQVEGVLGVRQAQQHGRHAAFHQAGMQGSGCGWRPLART